MQREKEKLLIKNIYEHKEYFLRVARRTLHTESDVEDVLQELVYKAFKLVKNLKEPLYVKTWLTRILMNLCYDHLRNRAKTELHIDSTDGSEDVNYHNTEIRQLVNMLEPDLKVVAILFYYEDMPQKEIGVVLNLPIGTVKSKLFDARKQLKIMLEMED